MKNLKAILTGAFAIVTCSLVFTGCKKEEESTDTESETSIDNVFAESVYDDAGIMADQAALNGSLDFFRNSGGASTLMSPCATITHDTIAIPHVITIDFGPVNCLCNDGRYRRGAIIITYNGHYRDPGSVHTIGFSNYYVTNFHVQGTKTVTNQGTNGNNHLWFTVVVNGSITSPGGQVMIRNSNREREWINGENTPQWNDDVYLITGTAGGTTFNGTSYTSTITTPLEKAVDCHWIKNGIMTLTPAGMQTRTINFGYFNGNCDRYAQLTVGNHTRIIELR